MLLIFTSHRVSLLILIPSKLGHYSRYAKTLFSITSVESCTFLQLTITKSTTPLCWDSNLGLYFETTCSITCETRKRSVTCLPLSQHTIASRTIPHSWNTFNSREWNDLKNSLAVFCLHKCYWFRLLNSLTKYSSRRLRYQTTGCRIPSELENQNYIYEEYN